MCTFSIHPGASLAIIPISPFLKHSPLFIRIYSHMLQVSVNYCGNSLCVERIYQPYKEHLQTTLVICHVMNTYPKALVSYLVFNPTIKHKHLVTHDTCISNLHFHVNTMLVPFLLLV